MKQLAPYELRRIEWHDSRGASPRWERVKHIKDDGVCSMVSVGYVIHETDSEICLAPHLGLEDDGDHQACGEMHIPTSCIIESEVLETYKNDQRD